MPHLPETVRSYRQIAAAGYVLARDPSRGGLAAAFKGAFEHLSGRIFFAEGRTPRFEVDGVALLGVALGASAVKIPEGGMEWFKELLRRSSGTLQGDRWQCDLVEIARGIVDKKQEVSIKDLRLRNSVLGDAPRRGSSGRLGRDDCLG